MRTVFDRQRAEEVVQEAFLKVWRQADRYESRHGAVGAWIYTIAKRTAIDMLRKEKHSAMPSEGISENLASPDHSDEVWTSWQINLALDDLPADQSEAVEMFILRGYTHVEIAKRLDVPLGTVKTRIYSGLKRLRTSFERHGLTGVRG